MEKTNAEQDFVADDPDGDRLADGRPHNGGTFYGGPAMKWSAKNVLKTDERKSGRTCGNGLERKMNLLYRRDPRKEELSTVGGSLKPAQTGSNRPRTSLYRAGRRVLSEKGLFTQGLN